MKRWSLCLSSVRLVPAIAVVAGFSLIALSTASLAEDVCGATAETCDDGTSALAEDLMRQRVDRTLAGLPTSERLDLPNTPGTTEVTPFVITPDGGNTNFNTSLSRWGSSLSAADQRTLKAASEASGENLPLPQSVTPATRKFDFWAKGRREAFSQNDSVSEGGNAVTTFMGADYRVDNDLLVGGMLQVDEAHRTTLAAAEAAGGTAYMAGPYLAYRVAPHIVIDAKTAWGTAQDSAVAGSESGAFATQRMLSEAKVSGQWGWQGWQLSQSGAVTYLDETSIGLAGASAVSVDVARLSVMPEVKRRFEAGENVSIEPFAFFKSSLDLADTGLAEPNALNTVGGGVTLAEPDSYSIRATADYTESTDSADTSEARGKVSVSVPTSILGF